MSHCFLCYDTGTKASPLINPCPNCNLLAHNRCMLNLMSTHLLTQKYHLLRADSHLAGSVGSLHLDGLHLNNDTFYGTLFLTPIPPYPTNYSQFLLRGGICSPRPTIDYPSGSILLFFEDWRKGKSTVIDVCPQCRRHIQATTSIDKHNQYFSRWECFFLTFKNSLTMLKESLRAIKLPVSELLSGLTYSFITFASYLPWLILGKDIPEYEDLLLSFPLGNPVDTMQVWLLGFDTNILKILPAYSILFASGLAGEKTFASYFIFFVFRNRFIKDFLYSITFNFAYIYLTDNDHNSDPIPDSKPVEFGEMGFMLETIYSIICDHKNLGNNEWTKSDLRGVVPDLNSFDRPFKVFLGLFLGPKIGKALITNCKGLVKFVYQLFGALRPNPVEIEMVFNYIGYELVLFIKECYDLVDFYFRVRSVREGIIDPKLKIIKDDNLPLAKS